MFVKMKYCDTLQDKFQDFLKGQDEIIKQFRSRRAEVPEHDYQTAMRLEAEMMGELQDFTFMYIDNLFFNKKDYRATIEFFCFVNRASEEPNFAEMNTEEIVQFADWCVKHI